MIRHVALLSLLFATTSLPALALDFGNGFSATGEFELEYLHSSSDGSETLGYGSTDIAFQATNGFGGFVGFDAVSLGGNHELAGYAALSYAGDFGKVQVGVPRAALDDYLDTPFLGGLRSFDVQFGYTSGSIVTPAYLLGDDDTPLGLRYDGTFGDLKVGASYHRLEDANVYDVAANYQLGSVMLRGGIEHINAVGENGTSYNLGAETTFDKIKAGLLYSDSGFTDTRLAQVYGVYSPIEALNLTATIWSVNPTGSGTSTIYGVAADYTFAKGAYVEGGYSDSKDGPSTANASIGVKF